MIANPGSKLASPCGPETPRARHPSESSCTAEANSVSFCDPNCSCGEQSCNGHSAYYNYGCSSSTIAVSSPTQSRTSCLSRASDTPIPLSASALLNQIQPKEAVNNHNTSTSSATDVDVKSASSDSPPRTHRTPSLPQRTRNYFNRGSHNKRASADRVRRSSTPESASDATTISNATVETRISCGTLTSDM